MRVTPQEQRVMLGSPSLVLLTLSFACENNKTCMRTSSNSEQDILDATFMAILVWCPDCGFQLLPLRCSDTGCSETRCSETGCSETGCSGTGSSETGCSETGSSKVSDYLCRHEVIPIWRCSSLSDRALSAAPELICGLQRGITITWSPYMVLDTCCPYMVMFYLPARGDEPSGCSDVHFQPRKDRLWIP